jgi:hypothetical protein
MILEMIFTIILIYLLCGLIFAFPFVVKGAAAIDETAHKSTLGFRLIIIPGTMVFWPVLLKKWLKASKKNHD